MYISMGTDYMVSHPKRQSNFVAHPASCPTQTGSCFPGSKASGMWRKSVLSVYCQGQECVWSYASTRPYVCMTWSIIKHRDNYIYDLFVKCCKNDVAWLWWLTVLIRPTLKELQMGKAEFFCICSQVCGTVLKGLI
jgi:hypothetical protein